MYWKFSLFVWHQKKATAREQAYEESMRDISARLTEDEERASTAERAVVKLTKDMDRLEGKYPSQNFDLGSEILIFSFSYL